MTLTNDDFIDGLPRRPRIADASVNMLIWAVAGGLIAGASGSIIGGVAGNAWANQRQPLEMAIRDYLTKSGLEVVFYYPAPRSVKVTFRYGSAAYWTVESTLPDTLQLMTEDTADWLYGNLITNELPSILQRIRLAS